MVGPAAVKPGVLVGCPGGGVGVGVDALVVVGVKIGVFVGNRFTVVGVGVLEGLGVIDGAIIETPVGVGLITGPIDVQV